MALPKARLCRKLQAYLMSPGQTINSAKRIKLSKRINFTKGTKPMSFVVQYPRSNTNPTDKYRVTHSSDLFPYMNGATTSYAFIAYNTYAEAVAARDKANEKT